MSDIEIAQKATMQRIIDLCSAKFGLDPMDLEPIGHYKAKLGLGKVSSLQEDTTKPNGKLILVTAMSPTPAGEGKTTTTVGLGDALNHIGKKAIIALREPSLGPVFGMKGGAAGGGYAQVVPMEEINLHFTGDFHAIGAAHNLLAAMVDNHIHQGNALNMDPRLVCWKRSVDMNDRALRNIMVGMGGLANGVVREDGYDIVVASEVMTILCLAMDIADLKERLGRIIVGETYGALKDRKTIYASDLGAHGAMAALLKDAIKPNLVQTLENNIALIHGGPFANISIGCNTVMATKTAMKLADYVVTEAGFGADLGAEKFVDIKCRLAGLVPSAVVLVATIKALKHHGGATADQYKLPSTELLSKGLCNLDRHINNIRTHYNMPVVVAINHFNHDTDEEVDLLLTHLKGSSVPAVLCKHWANGGKGAAELAQHVVAEIERREATAERFNFVYDLEAPLWEKIEAVASKIYGAGKIDASPPMRRRIERLGKEHPAFPVCIAKTQSSFSTDPTVRGAPGGHTIEIRELRVANGAGFFVVLCGDIMTMPGLPARPSAEKIDIAPDGTISGLF